VFVRVRERLAAATEAQATERDALHELIHDAHRLGVGPPALARWAGYNPSRIYQSSSE
jgi:hypothetical protein